MTIQSGIPVARIELMNEGQLQAVINYSKLEGFEIAPHLFYEFHGTTAGAKEQAERAQGSQPNSAEATSGGRRTWRNGTSSGPPVMTSTMPPWRSGLVPGYGPPMCACPSAGWPN